MLFVITMQSYDVSALNLLIFVLDQTLTVDKKSNRI